MPFRLTVPDRHGAAVLPNAHFENANQIFAIAPRASLLKAWLTQRFGVILCETGSNAGFHVQPASDGTRGRNTPMLMKALAPRSMTRLSITHSVWFQLAICLAFGVLLPNTLYWAVVLETPHIGYAVRNTSLVTALLALLIVLWLRKVSQLPGVGLFSNVALVVGLGVRFRPIPNGTAEI